MTTPDNVPPSQLPAIIQPTQLPPAIIQPTQLPPAIIQPTQLPPAIRGYLAAHAARDTAAALRAFTANAAVVDEGRTFRGAEEILGFLRKAGAEFTDTTELIGAHRIDDKHWVATNRLTGDFPGGTADLDYRFTMDDDLIDELVLAPRAAAQPRGASTG